MSTGGARIQAKPTATTGGAGGGGDVTSAKIAALSPEERAALHARLLARKQAAQQTGATPTPTSPVSSPTRNPNIPATGNTPGNPVQSQASAGMSRPYNNTQQQQPQQQQRGNLATSAGNPPVNPAIAAIRTATGPGAGPLRSLRGDSLTRYTNPDGTPIMDPNDPNGAGLQQRGLPSRVASERRPSQQVIDKEKKSDYWKEVARDNGVNKDLDSVISRAMSLGVVGDKKQRESISGPKSNELLQKLSQAMEQRVTELGGQKTDSSAPLMDKIAHLEKTLVNLEAKKKREEEEEKARVQKKISELESSLKNLQAAKVEQREKNRQTMKIEIDSLKEMMAKVQQDQTDTAQTNNQAMAQKCARLEAALRLLNEERKKETPVDDKETLLLKRKLALFEQKFMEMEAEKKIREESENSDALKEKLALMEDKLLKMEKRKSLSQTQDMQNKMETLEKQLTILRGERSNGHSDAINTKIGQKMQILEKQLHDLAAQKIVVNDPETENLRNQIGKLEETIVNSEKRLEQQRRYIEEERKRHHDERVAEEKKFRMQTVEKEKELIKRLESMETVWKQGGGGGGGANPQLADQIARLEKGGTNPGMANKVKEMEDKLAMAQKVLEEERQKNQQLKNLAGTANSGLEDWQKDAQIQWLMKTHADLKNKFTSTQDIVSKRIEELKKMQSSGGFSAGPVQKSGLSYADINAKLAEIQAQLFDPNIDERESERLNIEYEKLITELESTDEYKNEQQAARDKWKKDNEGPNRAAFDELSSSISSLGEPQRSNLLKKKPELKFLLKTPDQINKAHVNDFKQVSTQNLNLQEARALYHNMPEFRKDQEQQMQFLIQLQAKIESEMSKPQVSAPPPIQAKKKVVIKKAKGGDSGGGGGGAGFLDELLAKRKRKE